MNRLWTNLKSWYGVLFLVLLAGLVLWFVLNGMPYINNLRANWEAQRLQDQWEKPYREDKYGGKTPEETYDMFIKALKDGNVELASKYFIIEKQSNWKKTLEEYKKQNLLVSFVSELEETKNIWKRSNKSNENIASFTYINIINKEKTVDFEGQKITIPAGNYQNESIFQKYPSDIWKIETL